MDEVIIVSSPKAGSGAGREQIPRLVEMLTESEIHHHLTVSIDEMIDHVARIRSTGEAEPLVIAAGGDGTVSLVAKHLDCETRILPLPLGTENLLAKYFGHSCNAAHVMQTIRTGTEFRLDAGLANGQLFLVMVSCGFDADVVRRLHLKRRGHIRKFSYAKPIWQSLMRYSFPRIRVSLGFNGIDPPTGTAVGDGDEVAWAMVFNLPKYGGGLHIIPDSVGNDGKLDLITMKNGSVFHGLRYVMGIATGRHQTFSDVKRCQATKLRLESERRVPYQVDGDYAGRLPLEIEILPSRVRLLVPVEFANAHGSLTT
ncbi:diacylglycerol/lipid kinase family protein [Stieleria varia]|uniref:Putative lipid kinase n=1 Tax=Stieleria varia TaxID=2528005 RepID=A0A5C6B336_9BACT|nr:diacylglycerol kinase family protein [Stieleria varia]TWU05666.1 putative lipid kinase [Stieleria varia]